jgi:hypothetical protein
LHLLGGDGGEGFDEMLSVRVADAFDATVNGLFAGQHI